MPGRCDLLQKKPIMGNNVSNSNARTRKKFDLNLQRKTFAVLQRKFSLKISNHARRTLINKHGGCLISFLVNTNKLSDKALSVKKYVGRSLNDEQISSYKKVKEFNPKVKAMKKQPKARILKKLAKKSQTAI